MPFSTPTQKKPRSPHHVLLMGPPGSFKTTILLQFPKLRVADIDKNLDGPEGYLRRFEPWKSTLNYRYENICFDAKGETNVSYETWDNLLKDIDDTTKNDKDTLTYGVDGLTIINEACQRKVLKDQGNKSIMEPSYWGPFKTHMMNLMFGKLRSLNRDVIVLCHESYITKPGDMKSGTFMQEVVTGKRPTVNGGIADHFAGFFTDCWGVETIRKPGDKLITSVKVVRDGLFDYKNSLGFTSNFECETHEVFDKIKPKW